MRTTIAVTTAYAIGWAICFRLGEGGPGGWLAEPAVGMAFLVTFAAIHVGAGLAWNRAAALLLPLAMVPGTAASWSSIPLDPDIPGWRGIVVFLVVVVVVPTAACCVGT